MIAFYEHLYGIQKLLWYLRAYPNGSPEEMINFHLDSDGNPPFSSCIRKLMILMKLISEKLVQDNNHSSYKQMVSETLIKSFEEMKILCAVDLDRVNALVQLEGIFHKLANFITSGPFKTEKTSTCNETHKGYYQLLSTPLKHFQKQKLKNQQFLLTIAKLKKLKKILSKENSQLAKKLEKIEGQKNLEMLSHKLNILRAQTLANQALLAKRTTDENVKELHRELLNLKFENLQLKQTKVCKCIWKERKGGDIPKKVEVKPKLQAKVEGTHLNSYHYYSNYIEHPKIDTKVQPSLKKTFSENPKKNSEHHDKFQFPVMPPRKCYLKQKPPLQIYIHRRRMSLIINSLMKSLAKSPRKTSKNEHRKLCRDLKINLYALKDAADSLPHEKMESRKYLNQLNLKETIPITDNSNIVKENADRNAIGKTFGDRRRELLRWCQIKLKPYGIPMYEFSLSWTNGHALCALIHSYCPDLVDSKYITRKKPKSTLKQGVRIAKSLGVQTDFNFAKIYRSKSPDYRDVFNYVQELYYCLESIQYQRSISASEEN